MPGMNTTPGLGDYVRFPHHAQVHRSGWVVESWAGAAEVLVSSAVMYVDGHGVLRTRTVRRTAISIDSLTWDEEKQMWLAPAPAVVSFGWRAEKPA